MSDKQRALIRYTKEASFGTLPPTPTFDRVAGLVDYSAGSTLETSSPDVIAGDYGAVRLSRNQMRGEGSLGITLIYGDMDQLFAGAMRSDWQIGVPGVGSDTLENGNTIETFDFEEEFLDEPTEELIKSAGTGIAGFNLSFPLSGDVTGDFSMLGLMPQPIAATEANTTNDPVSGEIMAGLNISDFKEGSPLAALAACVQQIDLSFGSPLRGRWCIGSGLEMTKLLGQKFEVTGTLVLYNGPEALDVWKKVRDANWTTSALEWTITDPVSGNLYTFTIPALKFTAGDPDISSDDVTLSMEWTAIDPGAAVPADQYKLLRIVRTPAP